MSEKKNLHIVAIIGGRNFNDYEFLRSVMNQLHEKQPIDLVVSGGACGADTLGIQWAKECGIKTKIFLPNWNKFGKSAGFKRNTDIVDAAHVVVAFWDKKSRGTQDTIKKAKALGKLVYVHHF